jgi:hypothetical protein|tara:strand:+ start:607 stop:933 length:327 start_codon:yes stop_codon:yes gene_type:complete
LFRDIYYNEFAIQIAHAILGDGLFWNYYNSNTVHPHETRKQDTHHDAGPLFAGELDDALPGSRVHFVVGVCDATIRACTLRKGGRRDCGNCPSCCGMRRHCCAIRWTI